MNNNQDKPERIKVRFIGLEFECVNPTRRGLLIILMLLTFFVVLALLYKS